MSLNYRVQSTQTTRGGTRWVVVDIESRWIVNQRHLTRELALEQAAVLAMIRDERYRQMLDEWDRRRAEILDQHRQAIDVASEQESVTGNPAPAEARMVR